MSNLMIHEGYEGNDHCRNFFSYTLIFLIVQSQCLQLVKSSEEDIPPIVHLRYSRVFDPHRPKRTLRISCYKSRDVMYLFFKSVK